MNETNEAQGTAQEFKQEPKENLILTTLKEYNEAIPKRIRGKREYCKEQAESIKREIAQIKERAKKEIAFKKEALERNKRESKQPIPSYASHILQTREAWKGSYNIIENEDSKQIIEPSEVKK